MQFHNDITITNEILKEEEEEQQQQQQQQTYINEEQQQQNKPTLKQLFFKLIKHYFYRKDEDGSPLIINKKLCLQMSCIIIMMLLTLIVFNYALTQKVIEVSNSLTEITNKFDTPLYENVYFDNSETITGWTESDRIKNNWCNVQTLPPFAFSHYRNTTNTSKPDLKAIIRLLRTSLTQITTQSDKTDLLCITQSIMSDDPLNILVFRNGYVFTDIYKVISPKDHSPQLYSLVFPCKQENMNFITVTSSNITIYHSLGITTILDEQYSRCVQHYYHT
jgi:hypothetical protein